MKKTLVAAAIVITAAPVPGSAQTLLDKVIQRIGTRKGAPAAATPAAATPQADKATQTQVFPLDVAGVRLGMSASEAQSALVKAGYTVRATSDASYGPSFAARVDAEAVRRRTGSFVSPTMTDRVITTLHGNGPNRESISIGLTAVPAGGSIVTRVDLTIPQDVMKGDAFQRQAIAKYGKPDGSRNFGMTQAWCSAPLKSVCGSIAPFQRSPEALPNLTADVMFNQNTIRLQDGNDQGRERERAFAAAVDDAAPTTDRAAF